MRSLGLSIYPTHGIGGECAKKVKLSRTKPPRIYQAHLTDAQAKEVVRSYLSGVPKSVLVERTGFSETCIRNLCDGVNRSHILREVEDEMRKEMK